MARAYSPSYLGGRERRIVAKVIPGKELTNPHLNKQAGSGVVHLRFQLHGGIGRMGAVPDQRGQKP
jgi:hypothetical protein